jgi:hypothetical protein
MKNMKIAELEGQVRQLAENVREFNHEDVVIAYRGNYNQLGTLVVSMCNLTIAMEKTIDKIRAEHSNMTIVW